MAFRSPQHCKRFEYVSVKLENPLEIPANNANQEKSGYEFNIDSTHWSAPLDWYNAFFELDLKITEMDNTGYGAGDNASIINGGFGIISQMEVNFDGVQVLNSQRANHALNVKNLIEFSGPYSNSIARDMFHYPDTAVGAVSQKYTTLDLDGNAQNIAPTDMATYNEGFAKRKTLLSAAASNNIILPLNRFGYFNSFRDQICPNGQVSIRISLESDANVIFRANGVGAGRYIITKFVLWIPKMVFSPSGRELFVDKYLKPHTWKYLMERVEVGSFSQQTATFRVANNVKKPRHVFIWILNTAKLNNQEQNMFVFNTYNIANARTITSAQLKLGSGVSYPSEIMNPTTQMAKMHRELLEYKKGFNDILVGSTIDLKSFKDLYGILHFDLTHQEPDLKEGLTNIELNFGLNDTPNAEFKIFALILHEQEISVDVINGKAVLRT